MLSHRSFRFAVLALALTAVLEPACAGRAQVLPRVPAPAKYLGRFGLKFKDRLIPETLAVPGKPYRLGRFDVTNAQFAEFPRSRDYKTDAEREGSCLGFTPEGRWTKVAGLNWRSFAGAGREDYPVVCVSPNDAQAYLKWLSELTKENYRLPNEAEWQHAACSGREPGYSWGEARSRKRANSLSYWVGEDIDARSWSFARFEELAYPLASKQGGTLTTRVDLFAPNPWGFHDMAGNVWGITVGEDEKATSVRGGSWHNHLELLRCNARDTLPDASYRDDAVGFRVLSEPRQK